MKVVVSPKAEKQLKKLAKLDQIAVLRKIRGLVKSARISQEEKLGGYRGAYRVRVGNIRVVYLKLPDKFYVVLIAHRREIYLLLKRLWG